MEHDKEKPTAGNRGVMSSHSVCKNSIAYECENRKEENQEHGAPAPRAVSSFSIAQNGEVIGVYPYVRNKDKMKSDVKRYVMNERKNDGEVIIKMHSYGIELTEKMPKAKSIGGGSYDKQYGISRWSRKRMIQKTYVLEYAGKYPSHMLTLTLPPKVWEQLSSDEERVEMWKRAKYEMLQRIRKRLERKIKAWGAMWFVEFQDKRGAPHIHILIYMGVLTKSEWAQWLDWFVKEWAHCLRYESLPSQAVDFKVMRKNDFRYVRKYAGKMRQKIAPYPAHWGRWWQTMGSWARVRDEVYYLGSVMKEKILDEVEEIACRTTKMVTLFQNWAKSRKPSIKLFWSLIKSSDSKLAEYWLERREIAKMLC